MKMPKLPSPRAVGGHIREGVTKAYRQFLPLSVCLFASGFWHVAHEAGHGTFGIVGASLAFCWALDLAQAAGRVQAEKQWANRFLVFLTSGQDTMVTVTHQVAKETTDQ